MMLVLSRKNPSSREVPTTPDAVIFDHDHGFYRWNETSKFETID
jgi:hypothetical protein